MGSIQTIPYAQQEYKRPLHALNRVTAIAIVSSTGLSCVLLPAMLLLELLGIDGAELGTPAEVVAALVVLGGALIVTAVTVTAIVLFLIWFHRAHQNVQRIGRVWVRFRSTWAVVYWFIPFWNLVVPMQTMREIYRGSGPLPPDASESTIGRWWGAWLVSLILPFANLFFPGAWHPGVAWTLDLVAAGLMVVACVYVLRIMRWVTTAQGNA